jgi:hypothetical protein
MTPRLREIINEQRRLVARVPPGVVSKLVEAGIRLAETLRLRLRRIGGSKYETTLTRTKLAQVQALVTVLAERYGDDVAKVIERVQGVGAEEGRESLNAQLDAMRDEDVLPQGTAPAATDNAGALLDEGLLEIKEASRKAYTQEAMQRMRADLARGALDGETLPVTAERMAANVGISEARAERIVRTEHSYALHRRQAEDFAAVMGDEAADWRKQLVATIDDRTGLDSIFVNGQRRRISEPFRDNEGRVYMFPPNRPNDRETVIYVPAEDGEE